MKHVVAIFEIQGPSLPPVLLREDYVKATSLDGAKAAAEKLVNASKTHTIRASSFATNGKILVYVVKNTGKPKRRRTIAASTLAVKR